MLSQIEAVEGTLSLNNIVATLPQIVSGQASGIPSYIACSDCVKQAYNVINTADPAVGQQSNVTSSLTDTCGSSFLGMS